MQLNGCCTKNGWHMWGTMLSRDYSDAAKGVTPPTQGGVRRSPPGAVRSYRAHPFRGQIGKMRGPYEARGK